MQKAKIKTAESPFLLSQEIRGMTSKVLRFAFLF
jgi:hypothetical protein